ncbi:Clp protease ClpP [Brevibacillus centrosporus]|uniref:head maturation protease, ClpP-related n=3 Tax=Brevibacillus centrosporus TaxID=54910 RepID=UPI0016066A85|nr:head maturation protease, ClpP-related [Brevibacillus centrosporus]MEC2131825.1 Clp protease ClpP [Brevibacillus centrosporus]
MPKKIKLNGPVIGDGSTWLYDWLNMPYISASKISKELDEARGDDVELYINSGGGSVFAGSEGYTILKEYPGKVTAKITGVAASAASFLAMSADEIMMSPTAQMMIHNAATWTDGDKNTHSSNTNMLHGTDVAITNAYRLKTGRSMDELLDLMNKTTWMNAQQAVELGFADGILFDEENSLVSVSNSISGEIPPQVVDKLRDVLIGSMIKGKMTTKTMAGSGSNAIPFEGMDLSAILQQGGILNSLELDNIPTDQSNTKEEPEIMDFKELKEKHPNLVNEIMTQAITAERSRISALNELADAPGAAPFIKDAIENGETAGDVAMKIIKASAERVKQEGENRQTDAENSKVTEVVSQPPANQETNEAAEEAAAIENMVQYATELINKKGGRQ